MNISSQTKFTPEISIMMPTHNAVKYVDAAILSILSQDYKDWEMLVCDDGSNDETQQRLEFWATQDKRIRLLLPFGDHGHYVEICNRLLDETKGTYVGRMDADDISLPQRLTKTLEFLKDKRTAIAVGATALVLAEQNAHSQLITDFPWMTKCVNPVASEKYPVNMALRTFNRIVHSTLLARKQGVVDVGGYDDLFPLEDWDLMLKLTSIGDIYVLPEVLGIKRQHDTNNSKSHPDTPSAFQTIRQKHGLDLERLPKISEL